MEKKKLIFIVCPAFAFTQNKLVTQIVLESEAILQQFKQ